MSQRQSGNLTRRAFCTTLTVGSVSGMSSSTTAQAETFRLGGEVAAWRGRAPQSIAEQDNPTLQVEAGQQYRVVWENVDGQPHNFVILDANDNTLSKTEIIQEQGATQTVTFTATPEMAQYICEVHPTTMVGEIQISGGADGGEMGEDGGVGLRISPITYLFAAAVVLAVISPILFALLLFVIGTGDRTRRVR
ncbi:cupredoxin domain-containing protein [Haladaptatus pallidirubidus]|uniref:Blue (type 1) copper domain-containing protein n=2 Tax=Haladaptatus pallidirubidus TaxID=1008152 RepID=A0AAV3UDB6_9EURY|nr:plastocyanin/azurin family copper-binding protein [Haladaptatus pallidirubidus]